MYILDWIGFIVYSIYMLYSWLSVGFFLVDCLDNSNAKKIANFKAFSTQFGFRLFFFCFFFLKGFQELKRRNNTTERLEGKSIRIKEHKLREVLKIANDLSTAVWRYHEILSK